jgi:BirA family biotin operon repressor/biotin-[acetyl-CoA-carboxylase] ligase
MAFRILYYDTVDSANNLALSFAKEGAREGTVVVAEYQTKGRGRFHRKWSSPRGKGLLFSVILRPSLSASSVPILTHLAAKAVAEVLNTNFELSARLKKPNDVLVGGRKIAGILTESSGTRSEIDYVVVGIGLNVNTESRYLIKGATSIYRETGRYADKSQILNRILSIFWSEYGHVNSEKLSKKPRFQYA